MLKYVFLHPCYFSSCSFCVFEMATLKITNYNGELGANRKYYQFTASLPERHLLCGFVCSVQPPPMDSIYKDLEHPWRIAKTR